MQQIPTRRDIRERGPAFRIHTSCSYELADEIAEEIERGAFDFVAAGQFGITPATFLRWLERGHIEWEEQYGDDVESGEMPDDDEYISVHAYFYLVVLRARSVARGSAERKVFNEKPDVWLSKGPGRKDWGDGQATGMSVTVNNNNPNGVVTQQIITTPEQLLEVAHILKSIGAMESAPVVDAKPALPGPEEAN